MNYTKSFAESQYVRISSFTIDLKSEIVTLTNKIFGCDGSQLRLKNVLCFDEDFFSFVNINIFVCIHNHITGAAILYNMDQRCVSVRKKNK